MKLSSVIEGIERKGTYLYLYPKRRVIALC